MSAATDTGKAYLARPKAIPSVYQRLMGPHLGRYRARMPHGPGEGNCVGMLVATHRRGVVDASSKTARVSAYMGDFRLEGRLHVGMGDGGQRAGSRTRRVVGPSLSRLPWSLSA
jgi:hypothetical protein